MRTSLFAAAFVATALVSAANAHEVVYTATLAPEAIGATGSGSTTVTIDLDLVTMRVQANFAGLSGNTSASHIHGPTAVAGTGNAGVMTQTPTFSLFPLGVKAGTFDQTFDMSVAGSYNASFLNNATNQGNIPTAFNSLVTSLNDRKAYLNIHTSTFAAGEIRGYLQVVPEPTLLASLGGAAMLLRRRR